jgi:hypothetical protein
MSVNKLLDITAALVAAVATVIAAVLLVHELTTAPDPHALMHSLERWVSSTGYHLALIVLAVAGVKYLTAKR